MGRDIVRAPTNVDYSSTATVRAVRSETLQHPATVWPAGVGLLGGAALFLFTPFPILGGLVFAGGVGAGAVTWLVNYFGRRGAFEMSYHQALHERSKKATLAQLEELRGTLAEVECDQGSTQVDEFLEKFNTIRRVLERNLSTGELTYSRYLGIAEQVFRSALDNLRTAASLLMSIEDIDIQDLISRIEAHGRRKRGPRSAHDEQELASLIRRRDLYQESKDKIDALLAENEEALTGLNEVCVAAAEIGNDQDSSGTQGSGNMDIAMEDLVRLIKRAEDRSTRTTLTLTPQRS